MRLFQEDATKKINEATVLVMLNFIIIRAKNILNDEKLFVYCTYLAFGLIFVLGFYLNLKLTDDMVSLSLRSGDGYNFHFFVNKAHHFLFNLEINNLFSRLYWEGYGFIFWIFVSLLTFPFYLLHMQDMIIITIFQLSLIFNILSVVFLYKIAKLFTKNNYVCFVIVLFAISTTAFLSISTTFYTFPYIAFLSLLSLYLTLKLPNNFNLKDARMILLLCAIGTGIKITFLFMLPMLGLLMLSRLNWKINKLTIKMAAGFLLSYFLLSLLFYHPSSYWSTDMNYFRTVKGFYHFTNTDGMGKSYLELFIIGMKGLYFPIYVLVFLLASFSLKIWSELKINKSRAYDLVCIFIGILLAMTVIVLKARINQVVLAMYLIRFIYLLSLGFLFFDKNKTYKVILGVLFSIYVLTTHTIYSPHKIHTLIKEASISAEAYPPYRDAKKFYSLFQNTSLLSTADKVHKVNGLYSYHVLPFWSLNDMNTNIQLLPTYANIILNKNAIYKGIYDYILLSKKSHMFSSPKEIDQLRRWFSPIYQKTIKESRIFLRKEVFIKKNVGDTFYIKKHKYKVIYHDKDYYFLMKISK